MTAKRNHHFVPQFYFRRFSSDGRSICTLIRSTGKVVATAPIKGQASKDWFYGDVDTENALAAIEGHCSAALRELSALEDPTDLGAEHLDALLVHLVLQRSRTDAARQASKPMHDKFAKLFAEVMLNSSSELGDVEKDALREQLPNIQADPVEAQKHAMVVAMQAARGLLDLQPLLLLNKTNRPFLFGDAPVVFYNAFCRDVTLRGVLGLTSPGLLVLLPLTSWTSLLLMDAEVYRVRSGRNNRVLVRDLRDVAALNKLQIHAASGCAYFEDSRFAAYVQALWKEEFHRLTQHAGRVIEAPGFNARTGDSMGDIVHAFQPQLAFKPTFTFLKHEVLGDGDSRQLRRASAPFT